MQNYNLNQKFLEWNSLFQNWQSLQRQLKAKYKISHGGIFSSLSQRPKTWDSIKRNYFKIVFVVIVLIIIVNFKSNFGLSLYESFVSCLFCPIIIGYFLGSREQKKYDEKLKLINEVDKAFDLANNLLENDINVNYDSSDDPDGSKFENSVSPFLLNIQEFMDEKERRENVSNRITNHFLDQAEQSFERGSAHLKEIDNHLMKIAGKHYINKKQKQ